MATKVWQGGAPAVAQVQSYVFAGSWEAGDLVTCTIGDVSFVTTATAVAATTVDAVIAAWNALSASQYPQFAEITAAVGGTSATLKLTSDTAGVPFTCTVSTTEAGGGAADDQTIDGATSSLGVTTIANSGPKDWNTAANWDTNAVPGADTVIIENSSDDILYFGDQSAVTLTLLDIRKTFTGTIGLPVQNAAGYPEHRATYLAIGATTCMIGAGEGTGSGRIKIDFLAVQTACTVYGSGYQAETNIPAVLLKGTHAANVLTVLDGDVGVSFLGSDTVSVVATLTVNGGTLSCWATLTTANLNGGAVTIRGSAATATLNLNGATLAYESSGTITAANLASVLDATACRGATITTTNLYAGGGIVDPSKKLTHTNALIFKQNADLSNVRLELGFGRTLTVTA